MATRTRFASLFLLSAALIMYELFVMRIFAVGSWTNFGSLVISAALLGFGLSGTLLTFIRQRVEAAAADWLFASSTLFMLTLSLAYVLGQRVPFTPIFIGSDGVQFLWLGLYYLIYGVPFFCGALFIGVAFVAMDKQVHSLYFWNMLGSSAGGLLLVPLMYVLPPASLLLPILLLAGAASLLSGVQWQAGRNTAAVHYSRLAFTAGSFVAAALAIFLWGEVRVSEYKPVSYVRKYPDVVEVHHSYSPVGEMHVYDSSYLHFAPGLSDNAVLKLPNMPKQPYWGLYVDGNGPIGIMGKLRPEEAPYLDYLPMAAPYALLDKPRVLLVNLGGAINAQVARYKEASAITIVDRDPEVVRLMRDDPLVSAFTGELLRDPAIHTILGEPRAHCLDNPGAYDLVEISLIDSVGLSDPGGYAIQENYTYTVEAFTSYLSSLAPQGILSITVWNRLNPPRNVLRLMATVVQAMRRMGIEQPKDSLFVYDLFMSTATILVKNGSFQEGELYDLRRFAAERSFDVIYYPGIPKRKVDFDSVINTYQRHFAGGQKEGGNASFQVSDVYHLALLKMLAGRQDDVYHAYIFDVRPMTDDRPYYSGYLRFERLGLYLDQIRDVSEEWGFLLVLGVLLQSILFGLLVILLPVVGRWRDLFSRREGTGGVILYYACLGLGYMMVEIYLIQRLVLLLANPVYSTALVIATMLVTSALGNLVAPRIARKRATVVRIAVLGIAVTMAFYLLGLGYLIEGALASPLLVRVLLAIAVILPAAFFMGMPFPTGLTALTEKRPGLLPWAWGLNGGLSVTGVAVAQVLSVVAGFPVVLISVTVLYVLAGYVFTANEATGLLSR